MRRARADARDAAAGRSSRRPPHGRAAGEFVLYGREYCHLCEEMLTALREQLGTEFPITVVDVDSDPVLAERYGELVPVLMLGEAEICRYRHDAEKVAAFMAQSR